MPACSEFNPTPFEVPEATDARPAAITAHVEEVSFVDVASRDPDRVDPRRAVTTVDGLQAVRLDYLTGGDGLWPESTPVTVYAIDLSPGVDQERGTLLADTVGVDDFHYPHNQIVLDRMVRSIDIRMQSVPDDPSLVARYEGGGGGFSVRARATGALACLSIPPNGDSRCAPAPALDGIQPIALRDLQPVEAGTTGGDVFAVTAHLKNGETSTYLPAPIPGSEAGAFAFTFEPDRVTGLTLTDVAGKKMATTSSGGG